MAQLYAYHLRKSWKSWETRFTQSVTHPQENKYDVAKESVLEDLIKNINLRGRSSHSADNTLKLLFWTKFNKKKNTSKTDMISPTPINIYSNKKKKKYQAEAVHTDIEL